MPLETSTAGSKPPCRMSPGLPGNLPTTNDQRKKTDTEVIRICFQEIKYRRRGSNKVPQTFGKLLILKLVALQVAHLQRILKQWHVSWPNQGTQDSMLTTSSGLTRP